MSPFGSRAERNCGGIAQLVEQTAHIRWVIGPSPIAANFLVCAIETAQTNAIDDIKTSSIVAVYGAALPPLHSACGGTS